METGQRGRCPSQVPGTFKDGRAAGLGDCVQKVPHHSDKRLSYSLNPENSRQSAASLSLSMGPE